MNDSLQTTQNVSQNIDILDNKLVLIELIKQEGAISVIISVLLCLLLLCSIYLFFERYFILNKINKESSKSTLLKDIGDLMHESKLSTALDHCKRSKSPEGRVLYKGLTRVGKTSREIGGAMEDVVRLEIFELERKIMYLKVISALALTLGFFGALVKIIFIVKNDNLGDGYNMLEILTGLFVSVLTYLFYNILKIKVKKVLCFLQQTIVDFLDTLSKPVI